MQFRYSLLILLFITIFLSACSTSGGILSGSWQPGSLTHQHIRVLTVDTNNAQNIYAGDEQGAVFASSDAGQHWSSRSEGLPASNVIHALSVDATSQKLYLASDAGIFVSSDAAQHWHHINSKSLPGDSYTALAFDLHAPHTIYVGSTHHAVFVSTDDGQTWTPLAQGLPAGPTVNALTFDSDNHQLWAATSQGIYRYTIGTTSWQTLNTGLPTPLVVYSVQPASVSGGTAGLIFAGTSRGFFRSQDAGAHWAESQESLVRTNVWAVLVDFRKPTTVYVGTDVGPLRSDDSGQQWGAVAPGFPRGQPVYALTLGALNYAQLYAAADNVYLFPGTSGGINPTNLLPIVLVVFFFYLLLRFNSRNRAAKRSMQKPERISEGEIEEGSP
jgi:photosystem II stability/assembly factor-like uncharacterized protein